MKKLLQILAIPVLALALISTGSTVGAQASQSCKDTVITNTGPNSTNEIVCDDDTQIVIKCTNGTVIRIDVDQDANSGDAEVGDNTNGGDAGSGDAGNEANVDVDVDNACATATETPEEPTTPVTPVTPESAKPIQPTKTTSLPSTGEMTAEMKAGLAVGILLSLAVATRIGVSLFRKYSAN